MLELFFSASGAGTCIVLMMLILKDFSHSVAARAFFVLIFGAFVHLCHNWLPQELSSYAYMIESATPAFFWISCRLIFQEEKPLPRIGFAIALYSFIAPIFRHIISFYLGYVPELVELFGRAIPQWFEYALIIMGIVSLLKGREDDMVESRRRLRWAIMGAAGLSLGWSIFSFNFHFGSAASRVFAIDISILIIIWFLFKGRSDIWGEQSGSLNNLDASPYGLARDGSVQRVGIDNVEASDAFLSVPLKSDVQEEPEGAVINKIESAVLKKVKAIMLEGFYRRENLTLKDLAKALEVPEYKVRAVINKELGYRNFNEFINEYRIVEAAQRLIDEPDTPISNIALDVGYRTLSSFNRAFRKEKETTPTAYRES
jgi:AraC-like DNA-binding protein